MLFVALSVLVATLLVGGCAATEVPTAVSGTTVQTTAQAPVGPSLRQINDEDTVDSIHRLMNADADVTAVLMEVLEHDPRSMTGREVAAATTWPDFVVGFGTTSTSDGFENLILIFFVPNDAPSGEYPVSFTPTGGDEITATFALE
ncbi:MAG: hypothetical protein WD058_00765 [Dehalococcoidia bacterium]